jgi:hypothetical protein
MKNKHLLLLSLLLVGCSTQPGARASLETVPVKNVVNAIHQALVATQKDLEESGLPTLKSVTISLLLAEKTTEGVEAEYWVIAGSTSTTAENAQTIEFTLTPPAPTDVEQIAGRSLYDALIQSITQAAGVAKEAERTAKASESMRLELANFSATVKFSITDEGSGKVGFDVGPVALGASAAQSVSRSHQIQFKFEG